MKRIRMFLFAALAVIVAFGFTGHALAQDADTEVGQFHIRAFQVFPHANIPDASTALNQGIVAVGLLPPVDSGGGDEWPCSGGDADCSTIAPGGLVVGIPIQNLTLSTCRKGVCGQYYWTFEDDTASGDLKITILAKQGTKVVQKVTHDFGTITGSPGTIQWVWCDCAQFKQATKGPVTITVSTAVGTAKITGKTTINLE